jgi:hypothetical protein
MFSMIGPEGYHYTNHKNQSSRFETKSEALNMR